MVGVDVIDEGFQNALSAQRGKVGNLRLKGAGVLSRCINHGAAEGADGIGAVFDVFRKAADVGVKSHAEQRLGGTGAGGKRLGKGHDYSLESVRLGASERLK